MSYTVDVECRSPVDAAPYSSHEIVLDSFFIGVPCYFTFKLLNVKSQLLCISECYALISESSLVLVEKIVHFPEFALNACGFGRFGRYHPKLVNIGQGEVTEYET